MLTSYSGIKKFYFDKLLRAVVEVGELDGKRVLDFGCGNRRLRHCLKNARYIGYDIMPERSDIADPRGVSFDVMVANEVFYEMTESDIRAALDSLRPHLLVLGISRQGWLNKLGARILFRHALDDAITPPERELALVLERYRVVRKRSVLWLADVYLLKRR